MSYAGKLQGGVLVQPVWDPGHEWFPSIPDGYDPETLRPFPAAYAVVFRLRQGYVVTFGLRRYAR